nr:DUF4158 domain-containing protein [Acidomonas methanolica]
MARRRVLTEDQWANFLAVPSDERELIRHYTLGRDDPDIVATKRTARNRIGYAVLLCYLRHPDRVPDPDEIPPLALLAFVARQVGLGPAAGSPTSRYLSPNHLPRRRKPSPADPPCPTSS